MASTSSFPTCSGGVAFGRTRRAPSPSPRCAASRRLRPVSAQGGGGGGGGDARGMLDPLATPFQILGLDTSASYSAAQLKAAFRSRVKEFHPDVCKDTENADLIMKRVLEAYEILSGNQGMMIERNNVDPFDEPECEACDIFVNELLCIGTGCPYSCVKRAPHAFAFADDTGTARAISQGLGNDYNVQLAVGQCPRKCICYVTPCQRIILEEVLASVLMTPYDLSEAAVLDSLLSKATFENNRYKKPKRETKSSSDYVDWM
uniref:J domain-containing protein n=1 Tax=Leersia perrieri TaxID=77586 RepID=A0A0D9WG82_9ORYZ